MLRDVDTRREVPPGLTYADGLPGSTMTPQKTESPMADAHTCVRVIRRLMPPREMHFAHRERQGKRLVLVVSANSLSVWGVKTQPIKFGPSTTVVCAEPSLRRPLSGGQTAALTGCRTVDR